VSKGVKAKNSNKILSEDFTKKVRFNDTNPQVKFVGKGTILPPNTIVDIPFEAVGTKAVEVTAFKIYPKNVGQFLQVNKLTGKTEIQRNGRYLWRKTIPLKPADPNQWNRYSFDVTELMKQHPGGLLRLTLSIKRRHSSYSCPEGTPAANMTDDELSNWDDNKIVQNSGWDGISEFYQSGSNNK